MRGYEAIYILSPELDEEEIRQTGERFQKVITDNGGRIAAVDEWGRRRLAYEIADHREGHYVIVHFEADRSVPRELERVLNLNENVLRFLVFRVDADGQAAKGAGGAAAGTEEAGEAVEPADAGSEPDTPAEPEKKEE